MAFSYAQKTFDEAPNRHFTFDSVDPPQITSDARTNDNGHLIVDAYLSRSGIFEYLASEIKREWPGCPEVQKYPDNAILRAYRSADEFSKPAYLESMKYVPVTDNHPPHMLYPETTRGYPVGTTTGDARVHNSKPRVPLVLWAKTAIDNYRSGKRQISVGCYNRFVWGPGSTSDGEKYDFKIENSVVNHVAMVDRGRAGNGVGILDAKPEIPEKKTMKIEIKGASFDVDDNAGQLLAAERKEYQAAMDTLKGELDALKKKQLSKDELSELVDTELKRREAEKVNAERRQAVKDAGIDVAEKSDEYVAGVFTALGLDKKPDDPPKTKDAGVTIGPKPSEQPAVTMDRSKIDALRGSIYS